MNLATLEKNLEAWHVRKFGSATIDLPKTVEKLGEEYGELMGAILEGDPAHVAEEAADVLNVMAHIVREICGTGALNDAAVCKLQVIHDRIDADLLLPSGVLP